MNQQDLNQIPGRQHYSLEYLKDGRIFSFAHQINTAISFEPATILEVGAGGGVVTAALRAAGFEVTTLDVQAELGPDIVGSVVATGCESRSFDVALCCQVLEHLPFEQFEPALRELKRVTRQGLVLSLPDVTPHGFIAGKFPKIPEFRLNWQLPNLRPRTISDGQFARDGHYWEIGRRGGCLSLVLERIIKAEWRVLSTWNVPEMRYHRFFKLAH